jgi:hypothetical protein
MEAIRLYPSQTLEAVGLDPKMAGTPMDRSKKDRTMLMLRILVTLLILAMLTPGWGILSASTLVERQPTVPTEAIGKLSPFDR